MKIIGVIPARYQSSRFPGKPLADICGKPMIWWVYHQCAKVPELDEIYVATDDSRIFECCRQYGMRVMMTSDSHKTGTDRVAEVARQTDGDIYVNIQGDEPLIDPEEIRQVISIVTETDVGCGTLREEITDPETIRADSTVKVVTDKDGYALYFSRSIIPSNIKDGTLAKTYKHIGIYAFRKDFLLDFVKMPQTELELGEGIELLRAVENGCRLIVRQTHYSSIGVDYPEHIEQVEAMIRQKMPEALTPPTLIIDLTGLLPVLALTLVVKEEAVL